MARPNSATRSDLQAAFLQGATSQTGRFPAKPASTDSDIHDNKTSGAGVFIKKSARGVAARKNAARRTPA